VPVLFAVLSHHLQRERRLIRPGNDEEDAGGFAPRFPDSIEESDLQFHY
jgi:hypothetical protein